MKKLFEGIDPEEVNFSFVFDFGAELLAHLGIVCMCYDYSAVGKVADNSSHSSKSVEIRSRDTPFGYRVYAQKMPKNTDELLKEAGEEEFGNRGEAILKALVCRQVSLLI